MTAASPALDTLVAEGVTARAAGVDVIGATLRAEVGSTLAIVGAPKDGAGLLLALLAGAVRPRRGKVLAFGRDPSLGAPSVAHVEGLKVMDIGASTGGFTEVLLQRSVKHVTCIDVGHGQLHPRVASSDRITNFEKTHVRELTSHHFPELQDGAVIDVSFISLEKVFPFIQAFLKSGAFVVALVKPQFELEKKQLNKQGIVKSSTLYPEVLENVKRYAAVSQLSFSEIIESPITGGDGNKEFLMLLHKA